MKPKIFVDTLFLVALINKRDQYHQKALALAQQFESYPLITTDAIFLEVGNALSSHYKNEAVELIEKFLMLRESVKSMTPLRIIQSFFPVKIMKRLNFGY